MFRILAVLLLLLCSCNEKQWEEIEESHSGIFIDTRDGHEYKTVKTGALVWMVDNLNYKTADSSLSWCHRDDNSDCSKYGRMYNWKTAGSVCPSGWHLPNLYEWKNFVKAVRFLPEGGYCGEVSSFISFYGFVQTGWWTSTKAPKGIYLYNQMFGHLTNDNDDLGCSVRCVQDNERIISVIPDSSESANTSNVHLDVPSDSLDSVIVYRKEYGERLRAQLLDKYKTFTNWCRSVDNEISELEKFSEKDSSTLQVLTQFYNVRCVKPMEIVRLLLHNDIKKYEKKFNKPAPECRQCFDIEKMIFLVRAIRANTALQGDIIKDRPEPSQAIKDELKKVKVKYEKTFKRSAPWWWICSEEEHLERLKKALKTKKPYFDYSYGSEATQVGLSLANYEMKFNKLPPEWDCSDEERVERLMKALEKGEPYPDETAEAATAPVADIQHATESVLFTTHERQDKEPSVLVTKTATGAVAKYRIPLVTGDEEVFEIKLSADEWMDFLNALYNKLRINEWENIYTPKNSPRTRSWYLKVTLSNREFESTGYGAYPKEWEEFFKVINGIKSKILNELENELKAAYEKKFGKPITDSELYTEEVSFEIEKKRPTYTPLRTDTRITRTRTGATVRYMNSYMGHTWEEAKLSMDEWLDFINALYKTSFDKRENGYVEPTVKSTRRGVNNSDTWNLSVYNSYQIEANSFWSDGYPSNWSNFIKVINDVREKAKKDSSTRVLEAELKAEYRKRFGKPITDFELSVRRMDFDNFSSGLGTSIQANISRTATGAHIRYGAGTSGQIELLDADLSRNEWLDFLNSLKKCYDEGNRKDDICCSRNIIKDTAGLDLHYYKWFLYIATSSVESDILQFYASNICLPKWKEFREAAKGRK